MNIEDLEKKFSELLKELGHDQDSIDFTVPMMTLSASEFIGNYITNSLNDDDVRVIEREIIKKEYDQFQATQLYIDYWEDKTGRTVAEMYEGYFTAVSDAMTKTNQFLTKLAGKIKEYPEDKRLEEVKAYMNTLEERDQSKLKELLKV